MNALPPVMEMGVFSFRGLLLRSSNTPGSTALRGRRWASVESWPPSPQRMVSILLRGVVGSRTNSLNF